MLWCNVGFAEVNKWYCSGSNYDYINFELDKVNKILKWDMKYKNQKRQVDSRPFIYIDSQRVDLIAGTGITWSWYYGTDHRMVYENDIINLKCKNTNAQSTGISFTIKDKKEQCKAIGFKPASEKFADCVLKLVELDLKKQINDSSILSQNQANQKIANELKQQNNLRQSEFLLGLSQQLLNPSSPASNWSTKSCTVLGGKIKTINCW